VRVLVTTVIRFAPPEARSGRLLLMELGEDGRSALLADVHLPETPYRNRDPNPRGGTRGVRACVGLPDGGVAVATYAEIHLLNAEFQIVGRISHPMVAAIHDLAADQEGLWVTSTNADAIVRLDWSGSITTYWRPTDDPSLRECLGLPDAPPWGSVADYRDCLAIARIPYDLAHLNALKFWNGASFVSLGQVLVPRRPAANTRLGAFRADSWTPPGGEWSTSHIVVRHDPPIGMPGASPKILWDFSSGDAPNHNIELTGGRIWFNDSNRGRVIGFDADGRLVPVEIPIPGGFPRGMAAVGPDAVLVGTQAPLAVHRIDLAEGRLGQTWLIGTKARDESIASILVMGV
jgi:hypothetical protein